MSELGSDWVGDVYFVLFVLIIKIAYFLKKYMTDFFKKEHVLYQIEMQETQCAGLEVFRAHQILQWDKRISLCEKETNSGSN